MTARWGAGCLTVWVPGWKVVVGYNSEPRLRLGYWREHLPRAGRTMHAIGVWPLLIGVGRWR